MRQRLRWLLSGLPAKNARWRQHETTRIHQGNGRGRRGTTTLHQQWLSSTELDRFQSKQAIPQHLLGKTGVEVSILALAASSACNCRLRTSATPRGDCRTRLSIWASPIFDTAPS